MYSGLLNDILHQVLDYAPSTSDILLTVGKPIQVESEGELIDVTLQPELGKLTPWQMEVIASSILGQKRRYYQQLVEEGACDLSYALSGRARFRVNVFSQRGSLAVAMRLLPMKVPSIEDMDLPEIFYSIAAEKYGLVLLTGATGAGKSTSLATLVRAVNSAQRKHIVTLEDPIEFIHPHEQSLVNQRELGVDFSSFASGLRSALRQAPHIVLVGEIRDKETLEIALEAAETGHLVLGSLHTADTGQTVNRMVGMVDKEEERYLRERLSESLKYVISQRLMPDLQGRKVAAFEIMVNNLRIREIILHGEEPDKTFYQVLETSTTYGMFTFDMHLARMFRDEVISEEVAMINASDKAKLGQIIDKIKSEKGQSITDLDGLELDRDY